MQNDHLATTYCRSSFPEAFCTKGVVRPATLLKKRLWQKSFTVNVTKFFYKTPPVSASVTTPFGTHELQVFYNTNMWIKLFKNIFLLKDIFTFNNHKLYLFRLPLFWDFFCNWFQVVRFTIHICIIT